MATPPSVPATGRPKGRPKGKKTARPVSQPVNLATAKLQAAVNRRRTPPGVLQTLPDRPVAEPKAPPGTKDDAPLDQQSRVTINFPKLHPGQQEVRDHPARFKVLCCGRRWGKTRLGALLVLEEALKGGTAWWVAPTYKVADVGWRLLRRLAAQIPGAEIREADKIATFPGGGWFQVRSADDPDSLRGESLTLVVMDECAFIHERAWTEALRPALSDRKGRAIFISTPKGRNWFWRFFTKGQDASQSEWWSKSYPSVTNPFLDPEEIEGARGDMSVNEYRQEYEAVFLEDGGEVFRNTRRLSTNQNRAYPPEGSYTVAGVDLARKTDYTVLSIMDCSDPTGTLSELYFDRFNGLPWELQVERIAAQCNKFGVTRLIADATGVGDPVLEDLQRMLPDVAVEGVVFNQSNRMQILDHLSIRCEKETVRFVFSEVGCNEFEAFSAVTTNAGNVRYQVPDGMHDDTVFSRALSAWAAARPRRLEWT